MKHKLQILSRWSFALALGIFVFSYFLFHYTAPGGAFTSVYQTEPGKPLVTLLFSVLGVLFLFSSIMSALIARVFLQRRAEAGVHPPENLRSDLRQRCGDGFDPDAEDPGTAALKLHM